MSKFAKRFRSKSAQDPTRPPPTQVPEGEGSKPPPPEPPAESRPTESRRKPAHAAAPGFPEPPEAARGGVLGSKKSLQIELEGLRVVVDEFGYGERSALQAEIERLRSDQQKLIAELRMQQQETDVLQQGLVRSREELILQEVGIYDYHHRLEDSPAYKAKLERLRSEIKAMAKADGGAVTATTNWTVGGSEAKGRKMVKDISKLLLRSYNGEADVLINKMRPYKLDAAVDRLNKSRATITKLGATMSIAISDRYHAARVEELRLTADFLAKKEAEKEVEREEKAQLREEAKARKELEAEKARLFKEQAHFKASLERLRATGTPNEIAAAEATLADLDEAIHGVEDRAANVRAGYVYVISNFGAFGEEVVKIGMTRRLEPMDRVRELGDASVPFKFDVHTLVFSEDAVTLERQLHDAFEDQRVNMINRRREFFYATPAQVRAVLDSHSVELIEYVEEPEAEEWHMSANARQGVRRV